jgi:DNA-binding NarL/FixJ family response regulator
MHMRVIVADDDCQVRSALGLLLRRRLSCVTIVELKNGTSVLREMKRTPAAVLLLDWELPGYPTRILVSLLKDVAPNLHVIVLSSHVEARAEALAAGADRFISKGSGPDELIAALQELG